MPREVEHVGAIEQQVRPRGRRRRDRAVGGAPAIARLLVEGGQRLEPLLARLAAPALEPLGRERLAPPHELRVGAGGAELLLERVAESPGRLLGDRGIGHLLDVAALEQAREDLLGLDDRGIGREHRLLVGGRAAEAPERHHAAGPEHGPEDRAAREHVPLRRGERGDPDVGGLLAGEHVVPARRLLVVEAPPLGRLRDQDAELLVDARAAARAGSGLPEDSTAARSDSPGASAALPGSWSRARMSSSISGRDSGPRSTRAWLPPVFPQLGRRM